MDKTDKPTPDWQRYERLVALLHVLECSPEYCVTANASLHGRISKRARQIDVLIDLRHDTDNSKRIIVDAKLRKRKITVQDVEAFIGLMQDVAATHGYLVCPNGFTKSAERRAQSSVTVRLLPTDRLDEIDPRTWPKCLKENCKKGRVFWDGYPELSFRAVPLSGDGKHQRFSYIHYVGKCDVCRSFHMKCLTCDQIRMIPHDDDDDSGHQCKCKPPWFWLGSIETDEDGYKSAELHTVFYTGEVITANRCPLE